MMKLNLLGLDKHLFREISNSIVVILSKFVIPRYKK